MRIASSLALLGALAIAPIAAKADHISWTQWNPRSFVQTCPVPAPQYVNCGGGVYYYPAIASGTLTGPNGAPVTVTLNGQFDGIQVGYPSWQPSPPTFIGGTVSNAPSPSNNAITLRGGLTPGNYYYLDTLTFSSPLINPVIAIWSLGAPGHPASFVFDPADPFSIQSGGPNAEYAGQSITQIGNVVNGTEGNGVIQFTGTYSSIQFYTPIYENYFDFTVGSPVPEPSSLALLGTGLMVMVGVGRRKLFRKG